MKILIHTYSYNVWWGIYGLTEKNGWEDITLFDVDDNKIGSFCLNTKAYLESGIDELKEDPEEAAFVQAIETYLHANEIHYWYYYSTKDSVDFYEIPYDAPKNSEGVKPCFLDIWHPNEAIGINTIKSAAKAYVEKFLGTNNYTFEIKEEILFPEALASFKKEIKLWNDTLKVEFTTEIIEELSDHWNTSKENVLQSLQNTLK